MKNIVVLVSGCGTNLQALIDAEKSEKIINGKIVCVISSNEEAYAIERARQNDIKTRVIKRKDFQCQTDYDEALTAMLREEKADLVVLAGFMTIFGNSVVKAFENKIINVHPSLIPSFCGKGFYGLLVHKRALERGVKLTGATVHFVNEVCDGGPIIMQKPVEVKPDDTPETLQRRVMEQAEWEILPKSVSLFCQGKLIVENGRVTIVE